MTDAERLDDALIGVVDLGTGAITALLLCPNEMHRPALCFGSRDLDALSELELLRWEDRNDGRWYCLTALGALAQDELTDLSINQVPERD